MSYQYIAEINIQPYGNLTVTAKYHPGHVGSYWHPPEPDEVSFVSIIDSNGNNISLSDEIFEAHYDYIVDTISAMHNEYLDKEYSKYAEEMAYEQMLEAEWRASTPH
jgi:hypothetical protein